MSGTDPEAAASAAATIATRCGSRNGPLDARFHSAPGGLADLVEGRASPTGFAERFRGSWWGANAELRSVLEPELVEAALSRLATDYMQDPLTAARACFVELASPLAARSRGLLVDVGEHNLPNAQVLHKLAPDARFVSAVRDGRYFAHRELQRGHVPGRSEALDRWLERVRSLDVGVQGEEDGGPYRLPADRLEVIVPEASLGDAPGSSRSDRRLERLYARLLAELQRDGAHCAEALTAAYERSRRPG